MEETNIELNKQYIRSTGKWMKFLGIIMIISCVLMLIAAIACIVGASALLELVPTDNPLIAAPSLLGVIYLICAGIYIIPIVFMLRAANAAKNYTEFNNEADLTTFLQNSKSYWKFCGILTIIALVIAVVAILISIIAIVAIAA